MPALNKPLMQLTVAEIQALIDDEWVEDEVLEFKQTLSHTSAGKPDPWLVAQQEIGQGAKRDLLAEVVAMANSYGGDVVLGIIEADEKPHRAVGIDPLPKCAELASRLEHAARDLIKPQIPMLGVRGIPTDGVNGLVIFRVPRSRVAPHRLEMKGIEKECYKRTSDRTETMGMREIQDLTFSVSRGLAQTEERLAHFAVDIAKRTSGSSQDTHKCGFAVYGVPLTSDLYIEKVHNNSTVTPVAQSFSVRLKANAQPVMFRCPTDPYQWRPILRGTETVTQSGGQYDVYRRLSCDCSILQIDTIELPKEGAPKDTQLYLYPDWIFASVLNLFENVERIRSATAAHSVDYAISLTIAAPLELVIKRIGGGMGYLSEVGRLAAGTTQFPTYQLGQKDSWNDLFQIMWRDFLNAIGVDFNEAPSVDGW
jgi:hypothetical protein